MKKYLARAKRMVDDETVYLNDGVPSTDRDLAKVGTYEEIDRIADIFRSIWDVEICEVVGDELVVVKP